MTFASKGDGSDGTKVIDRKGKFAGKISYTVEMGQSVTSVTFACRWRDVDGWNCDRELCPLWRLFVARSAPKLPDFRYAIKLSNLYYHYKTMA